MSALDSDELISVALKKVGNETLADDAKIWLANILDRLYEDFKFPFLEDTAQGALTSGQSSVTLPADFFEPWDVNSFMLIGSDGGQYPLSFNTQYDQDNILAPSVSGGPRTALIDLAAMTWRPYPLPEQAYTWNIRYRKKPVRDDGATPYTPLFPNDQLLIQALFVEALDHEDDDRYPMQLGLLHKMVKLYQGTFNKMPNKSQTTRLSSKFGTPQSFR